MREIFRTDIGKLIGVSAEYSALRFQVHDHKPTHYYQTCFKPYGSFTMVFVVYLLISNLKNNISLSLDALQFDKINS